MNQKAKDDKWAKDNGHTLQRDSCPKCQRLFTEKRVNSIGEQLFCSLAHTYEVSMLKGKQRK